MDEAEAEIRLEINNDEPFPDLSRREEIEELNIIDKQDLTIISSLPPNLEDLAIFNCEYLVEISELPLSLGSLHIEDCRSLRIIPFLQDNVKELSINRCASLETITNLPEGLKHLSIEACPLEVLPPLPISLTRLTCEVYQLKSWRKNKSFLKSLDDLLEKPDFMIARPGHYKDDIEKAFIINELQKADTDEVLIVTSNAAMMPGSTASRVLNDPSISANKLLPYFNDNSTRENADLIQSQTELGQTIAATHQGSASASNLKLGGRKSKKQRKSKKSRKSKRRKRKYTKKRRRTSKK
jgi:hypothetical protein